MQGESAVRMEPYLEDNAAGAIEDKDGNEDKD